jgi:hypothetical protein
MPVSERAIRPEIEQGGVSWSRKIQQLIQKDEQKMVELYSVG